MSVNETSNGTNRLSNRIQQLAEDLSKEIRKHQPNIIIQVDFIGPQQIENGFSDDLIIPIELNPKIMQLAEILRPIKQRSFKEREI
ncbi:11740_t:CDS:1, partial [Ambispora gerdemannii]